MKNNLFHFTRIVIGAAAFVGLTTMQAMAIDLTGTWEGKVNCQLFIEGQPKSQYALKDFQFQITQTGTDLNLQVVNPLTGNPSLFDGAVVESVDDTTKGEVGLLECTSGVEKVGGAMIRAKVMADPISGKSKATGTVLFVDAEPVLEVGTCKINFKRIDATDPNVPSCF
jgi:hypothetical protein